jgi:Domain of unknown function (DUF1735)/Domain of unknown function (DUF4361)
MKAINQYTILGIGMAGTLFLSSCLKDSPVTTNFNVVQPVIEQLNPPNFAYSNANSGSLLANQNCYFMQVREDSTYSAPDSVVVNIAGSTIGKDVAVTITVDTGAFNTFNANNGGTFVMVPSAAYSIPNPTGTIKAGTQQFGIPITFNTKLMDFTQPYILPITITNASGYGISGNYGTTLYAVVGANQYMGLYRSVGQRKMGAYTYSISDLKTLYDLSTITAAQGTFPTAHKQDASGNPDLPTAYVPNTVVTNCADQTIYLSIGEQMDLVVNPDNSVNVINDTTYGFGATVYSLNSGSSSYNASTHVFTLSYGFIDPVSGDSAVVSEVMTRIR